MKITGNLVSSTFPFNNHVAYRKTASLLPHRQLWKLKSLVSMRMYAIEELKAKKTTVHSGALFLSSVPLSKQVTKTSGTSSSPD